MADYKKEFLITEYSSLMEHFRSYQSNRLNIILAGIPITGAIALNAFEKTDRFVVLGSILLMYGVPVCLVLVDKIFMKRLRRYSKRLAFIEAEFEVMGYSRERLDTLSEESKSGVGKKKGEGDQMTQSINRILHFLNFFISSYALGHFIKLFYLQRTHYISDPYPWMFHLVWLPVVAFFAMMLIIWTSVSAKNLSFDYLKQKSPAPAIQQPEATSQSVNTGNNTLPLKVSPGGDASASTMP